MRASRALRRRAIEHSTERVLAILTNEVMPKLIDTMRRMYDIQKLQNDRLAKGIAAALSDPKEEQNNGD